MKEIFLDSKREVKEIGLLSTTQKQAVRVSSKTGEQFSIFLLNVDLKTISRALSKKLKKQQTAYVKNRSIGENRRLISDVMEITEIKNIGFLVTMDIGKALD